MARFRAIRIKKEFLVIAVIFILVIIYLVIEGRTREDEENNIKVAVICNGTDKLIDVEEYVTGVLAYEIPVNYDIEAIKALAVVLRSYIINIISNVENKEDSILAEEFELTYIDINEVKDEIGEKAYMENMHKYEEVVKDTKGEVIFYKDNLIVPLYHYVSAGNTRNSKDVFEYNIDYLKSVKCEQDMECEDYLQIKEYSKEEWGSNITINKTDDAGYVLEVCVGDKVLTGEEYAKQEGLNSSCFYHKQMTDGNVRLIVKGKGHGFGMSLYGAHSLAKKKYDYVEIIKYFYSNVEVVKID